MADNVVFWRYNSDETVWHLYTDCPMLRAAKEEGLLCSGTVEAAINTGRQSVCPMCKRRYGGTWEKTLQEIREMDAKWDGTTVYWRQICSIHTIKRDTILDTLTEG